MIGESERHRRRYRRIRRRHRNHQDWNGNHQRRHNQRGGVCEGIDEWHGHNCWRG
jgi:hypothetical protein